MPFSLTPERTRLISSQLGVSEESIRTMHKFFEDEFLPKIKSQYLAHAILAMEKIYMDFLGKNDSFYIKLSALKGKHQYGRVQYSEERRKHDGSIQSSGYIVSYYSGVNEKKKRVVISHELGHILNIMLAWLKAKKNKEYQTFFPNAIKEEDTEPNSSLFGLLALMDKNQFYSKHTHTFMHDNFEALLQDFESFTCQS